MCVFSVFAQKRSPVCVQPRLASGGPPHGGPTPLCYQVHASPATVLYRPGVFDSERVTNARPRPLRSTSSSLQSVCVFFLLLLLLSSFKTNDCIVWELSENCSKLKAVAILRKNSGFFEQTSSWNVDRNCEQGAVVANQPKSGTEIFPRNYFFFVILCQEKKEKRRDRLFVSWHFIERSPFLLEDAAAAILRFIKSIFFSSKCKLSKTFLVFGRLLFL